MNRYSDGGRILGNGKLVAKYTLTPTNWLSTSITVDTVNGTLTIPGHTLVLGDQVVLTYQKGRSNNSVPTPFIPGNTYFVRAIVGDTFKLATANNDTTFVLATGLGTSGTWRLEKLSGVGSITFSNLNLDAARVVLRNGGFNVGGFTAMYYRINGVTDNDTFWYAHQSASGNGSDFYHFHGGSTYSIKVSSIAEFYAQNNSIVARASVDMEASAQSSQNPTTKVDNAAGGTKIDSRFSKITSIQFIAGGGTGNLNGDFTMEVYEI